MPETKVMSREEISEYLSAKYRLDFNVVQQRFIERGYELLILPEEYRNAQQRLPYICPQHKEKGIQYIRYCDIYSGKGCRWCGILKSAQSRKRSIEEIRELFNDRGYVLLTEEYKNNKQQMEFLCPKHPDIIQKVKFYHFWQGIGCHECGKEATSGENHHCWKGGITPEKSRIRNSAQYKYWRVGVLISDGHTCQCCGNRSKKDLVVHHIENFAERPELRFVVSNGITLCKYCHSAKYPNSFHAIYGCKNNNRKQLYEYLSNHGTLVLTSRVI